MSDPRIYAARPVFVTFLANTVPTVVQATQLAEYFRARPQAMVNSLKRYEGRVGTPWAFQVMGRRPVPAKVDPLQIRYGVVLLPVELAYPWTNPQDWKAVTALVDAFAKGQHEATATRPFLQQIKQQLVSLKAAVDRGVTTNHRTDVQLVTYDLPFESDYTDAVQAVIYQSLPAA